MPMDVITIIIVIVFITILTIHTAMLDGRSRAHECKWAGVRRRQVRITQK